ncbi:IS1634 family transposase, partial [Alkalicoccus chagannorensis]|uniref:IS1634 family transposase n=1 Tax=Alkalicoccus chagannorensis TaxID=427072 RepID=UPI0039F1429A
MQFASKHPIALMTYSRLLYPDSKRSTYEGKERFAGEFSCTLDHLYRSLGFLAEQKEHLEKHLHKQLSMQADRQLAVAFYDVTTYYFESVQADTLKKFGFSKDNKVNQVQVVMGLLIDEHGIPVSYDLFPGNTSDFRTLEPALNRVKAQYGITKLILVADRGLNSKRNLALLKSLGFEYIMGYKIRSGSKKAKEMVLDPQGYTSESAHFKWKKCDFTSTFRENGQTHTLEDHLLLTWSQKRQHKDR